MKIRSLSGVPDHMTFKCKHFGSKQNALKFQACVGYWLVKVFMVLYNVLLLKKSGHNPLYKTKVPVEYGNFK